MERNKIRTTFVKPAGETVKETKAFPKYPILPSILVDHISNNELTPLELHEILVAMIEKADDDEELKKRLLEATEGLRNWYQAACELSTQSSI